MKTIIQIKTDWQGNQNNFRQSQWAHSTKDKEADNTQNKDLFHKKCIFKYVLPDLHLGISFL